MAIAAWGLIGGTLLLLEGLKSADPSGPRNSLVLRDSVRKIWHLLSHHGASFCNRGPGFYATRIGPRARKRGHIRQLEALGCKITLQPAA